MKKESVTPFGLRTNVSGLQTIEMKNMEHNTPVDTIEGYREVNKYYRGIPIGYLDLFNNSS